MEGEHGTGSGRERQSRGERVRRKPLHYGAALRAVSARLRCFQNTMREKNPISLDRTWQIDNP